jgi:4-hydroxybenzoate polyprenyltransferase
MRPYLCFVSCAAGLVGLALGRASFGLGAALAAVALFLSYGFGQALTDVFQTDTDSRSAPYRPLCRGELRGRDVLAVSLVGLAGCGLAVALSSPWALGPALLGVAGLGTYGSLKRRWWGGPAWNSAVVALLPVIGALVAVARAGKGPGVLLADAGLGAAALSVLFSYAVFVIIGYLKDVEADRATGYDTLPVRFGRRTSVGHSAACALLGLGFSALLLRGAAARPFGYPSLVGWAFWVAAALLLGRAHVRAWAVRRDEQAHPAVADSVRAFVLLHLGEVVLLAPSLVAVAVTLELGFELALARRPERSQI